MSQHNKSNSDVQLKNKLNIVISKKIRKLNLEKQLIDIRKSYRQNYVKLNSNACEVIVINHKNNLQPSAKDNQITQIKIFKKSSNKSNFSKKSNLVIGDSILEGLDEPKMSSKRAVKVRNFLGTTTDIII